MWTLALRKNYSVVVIGRHRNFIHLFRLQTVFPTSNDIIFRINLFASREQTFFLICKTYFFFNHRLSYSFAFFLFLSVQHFVGIQLRSQSYKSLNNLSSGLVFEHPNDFLVLSCGNFGRMIVRIVTRVKKFLHVSEISL